MEEHGDNVRKHHETLKQQIDKKMEEHGDTLRKNQETLQQRLTEDIQKRNESKLNTRSRP